MAQNSLSIQESLLLRENNPYSLGEVFVFENGDTLLDLPQPVIEKTNRDRYYTVEKGDTIWTIAKEAYNGDSKKYWIILFANGLDHAFQITVGDTLLIPDWDGFRISSLKNREDGE